MVRGAGIFEGDAVEGSLSGGGRERAGGCIEVFLGGESINDGIYSPGDRSGDSSEGVFGAPSQALAVRLRSDRLITLASDLIVLRSAHSGVMEISRHAGGQELGGTTRTVVAAGADDREVKRCDWGLNGFS